MKTRTRRFLKLTIGVELKKQLVTSVKIRRGPCDDNSDFKPVTRPIPSSATTTRRTTCS
jgi:hypothetical protein